MRSKCARHPETENRAHRRTDASRVRNRIVQSESQYTVAAMPVARALSALWPRLEKAFNEIGRLRTNLNLLDASVQSSLPGLRVRASIVVTLHGWLFRFRASCGESRGRAAAGRAAACKLYRCFRRPIAEQGITPE